VPLAHAQARCHHVMAVPLAVRIRPSAYRVAQRAPGAGAGAQQRRCGRTARRRGACRRVGAGTPARALPSVQRSAAARGAVTPKQRHPRQPGTGRSAKRQRAARHAARAASCARCGAAGAAPHAHEKRRLRHSGQPRPRASSALCAAALAGGSHATRARHLRRATERSPPRAQRRDGGGARCVLFARAASRQKQATAAQNVHTCATDVNAPCAPQRDAQQLVRARRRRIAPQRRRPAAGERRRAMFACATAQPCVRRNARRLTWLGERTGGIHTGAHAHRCAHATRISQVTARRHAAGGAVTPVKDGGESRHVATKRSLACSLAWDRGCVAALHPASSRVGRPRARRRRRSRVRVHARQRLRQGARAVANSVPPCAAPPAAAAAPPAERARNQQRRCGAPRCACACAVAAWQPGSGG
jgi:hypothetical protein